MKKLLLVLLCVSLFFTGCRSNLTNSNKPQNTTEKHTFKELKGVWISYLELNFKEKGRTAFTKSIEKMFSDIKQKGFNAVFVHVRSHSDAFYNSSYFPFSAALSENQGNNIDYDPLEIMCYFSKILSLEIHAWINPFRVTSDNNIEKLSADNPALLLMKSDKNSVKKTENGYYYNPAKQEVQTLIINGVREIAENYAVNGIHFDDYFYPTTDKSFDNSEYLSYKSNSENPLSLGDWRRENVNKLVKAVYSVCKKNGKIFGISPHCSFYNNYNQQYADIEKWCNDDGYIDYIAPQLYFGFECDEKTPDNQSLEFKKCLEYWLSRTGNKTVYIGLGLYRSGEKGEFSKHFDIIKRQIVHLRGFATNGFIIFSYSYFSTAEKETENLLKVI